MAKLYPPIVEGKIPAFYAINNAATILVPYKDNRIVNYSTECSGFECRIKTLNTETTLITVQGSKISNNTKQQDGSNTYIIDDSESYASFSLTDKQLKLLRVGQFYKIQIAYIDNTEQKNIGYYSDIAIIKYTSQPSIFIQGYNKDTQSIINRKTFIGVFGWPSSQSNVLTDFSEKEYSYQFDVIDSNSSIVETSGLQLHRSQNDNISYTNNEYQYETHDYFACKRELKDNEIYYLRYTVYTINNLRLTSTVRINANNDFIELNINATLEASLNYDKGAIEIYLNPTSNPAIISGSFVLSRANAETNFEIWETISVFTLNAFSLTERYLLWDDDTVEHGNTYHYALQQFNNRHIYTKRLIANGQNGDIKVDFEHMYLFDADRTLKIAFNPKVSSFKIDVLEQKTDTIGNKYPFIFRNGHTYYREFPISGLISYKMDDEYQFIKKKKVEIGTEKIETYYRPELGEIVKKYNADNKLNPVVSSNLEKANHDLNKDNIYAERKFRTTVLEWLTNGKPKVFKSPTEGNFIVRLLNVSLSPNDTVGRMLSTFSCTAYEIAEYNMENLLALNLISIKLNYKAVKRFCTFNLYDNWFSGKDNSKKLSLPPNNIRDAYNAIPYKSDDLISDLNKFPDIIYNVRLEQFVIGTKLNLSLENESSPLSITIGRTGNYYLPEDKGVTNITLVEMPEEVPTRQGLIRCSYFVPADPDALSHIVDYNIIEIFKQYNYMENEQEETTIIWNEVEADNNPGILQTGTNMISYTQNNILEQFKKDKVAIFKNDGKTIAQYGELQRIISLKQIDFNTILSPEEIRILKLNENNNINDFDFTISISFKDKTNTIIQLATIGHYHFDEIDLSQIDDINIGNGITADVQAAIINVQHDIPSMESAEWDALEDAINNAFNLN